MFPDIIHIKNVKSGIYDFKFYLVDIFQGIPLPETAHFVL